MASIAHVQVLHMYFYRAIRWALGCVISRPAARGSKEAGFTQPRAHLIAHLCKFNVLGSLWLATSYCVLIEFCLVHTCHYVLRGGADCHNFDPSEIHNLVKSRSTATLRNPRCCNLADDADAEIIALYFGANLLSPENGVRRTDVRPRLACHLLL